MNNATKLIKFMHDHDAFIVFPDDKDYKEWFALLDGMKVPYEPPTKECLQEMTYRTRLLRVAVSLLDTMDNWKEIMLSPVEIKGRNGEIYTIKEYEIEAEGK